MFDYFVKNISLWIHISLSLYGQYGPQNSGLCSFSQKCPLVSHQYCSTCSLQVLLEVWRIWASEAQFFGHFGHLIKQFPLVSHQSWLTSQFELLLEVCWISAPEARFSGHFVPQNISVIFPTISTGFASFRLNIFSRGTWCISIMCPKGPRVEVAAELLRPSGLLLMFHWSAMSQWIQRSLPLLTGVWFHATLL